MKRTPKFIAECVKAPNAQMTGSNQINIQLVGNNNIVAGGNVTAGGCGVPIEMYLELCHRYNEIAQFNMDLIRQIKDLVLENLRLQGMTSTRE